MCLAGDRTLWLLNPLMLTSSDLNSDVVSLSIVMLCHFAVTELNVSYW